MLKLQAAKSEIEAKLASWQGRPPGVPDKLERVPGYDLDPVLIIREVMESLPDHVVPENTTGLEFIADEALRNDLRADIASVDLLLHTKQWKAAMVIAGSVTEALLLYSLLELGEDKAKEAAEKLNLPSKKKSLDEWHLPDYVEVARTLEIITSTCADQARIAQDYRNLIHPGKERREGRKASHPDALSSEAGLAHVVEEVTRWWAERRARAVD